MELAIIGVFSEFYLSFKKIYATKIDLFTQKFLLLRIQQNDLDTHGLINIHKTEKVDLGVTLRLQLLIIK